MKLEKNTFPEEPSQYFTGKVDHCNMRQKTERNLKKKTKVNFCGMQKPLCIDVETFKLLKVIKNRQTQVFTLSKGP